MIPGDNKGGALLYIIVLMVLFGALAAALLPFVTTRIDNRLSTVGTHQARLSVEAGLRLAEQAHCANAWDGDEPLQFNLPTGTLAVTKVSNTFIVHATAYQGTAMQAQARESFGFVCDPTEPPPPPDAITENIIASVSAPSLGGSNVYGDVAVLNEQFNFVGSGGGQGTFIEGNVFAEQGIAMSGAAIIRGDIYSDGDVRVTQGFVRGDVHNAGDFTILGSSRINGNVYSMKDISIGGSSEVIGDVHSCTSDVSLSGSSIIRGSVFAHGNVSVGSSVVVEGSIHARGTVTVQGRVEGDVFANENITAGSSPGIRIMGNSHAGDVISITGSSSLGGNATAGTSISNLSRVNGIACAPCTPIAPLAPRCPDLFDFSTLAPPPKTNFTAGGANLGNGAYNQSITVAPGSYGAVNLSGSSSKLRLSSGSYYFTSIALGWNGELYLDLSDNTEIRIFITGNVTTSNLRVFVRTHSSGNDYQRAIDRANGTALIPEQLASLVYLETHGSYINTVQSDWFGTLHAPGPPPNGNITLTNGSVVVGAVFGGGENINLNGTTLLFVPPLYFNTTP